MTVTVLLISLVSSSLSSHPGQLFSVASLKGKFPLLHIWAVLRGALFRLSYGIALFPGSLASPCPSCSHLGTCWWYHYLCPCHRDLEAQSVDVLARIDQWAREVCVTISWPKMFCFISTQCRWYGETEHHCAFVWSHAQV